MIRTVLTPAADGRISLIVPSAFIGQQVEVIAFTVSEAEEGGVADTEKHLPYLFAQSSLAKDWASPEEDEAWQDL